MGVQNGFIRIEEGFTRINLKLKTIDGTEINGQGPVISEEKVELLMDKLNALGKGDTLFLSGSIPASMPNDAYQRIMEKLDGRGVQIVVDATKDLLMNVLPYHPFLIKPNNHELGEIFGVKLKTRESVWWQDSWQVTCESRITNMLFVWAWQQEVPVHFRKIWQPNRKSKLCINK